MIGEGVGWGIALRTGLCGVRDVSTPVGSSGLCPEGLASPVPRLQMLSFMHAQYSFFQQGYSLLHQLDPYMKKLAAEVSAGGSGGGGGPRPVLLGKRVHLPPRCPSPTARPAGDRLGGGEAGHGAKARGHPAAGEALQPLTSLHGRGTPRDHNPLIPSLGLPTLQGLTLLLFEMCTQRERSPSLGASAWQSGRDSPVTVT